MKRILLSSVAVALLLTAFAFSGNQKLATSGIDVEVEARNPWSSLQANDSPDTFRFAVVSDRTGGHRARVFSQAVEQLNLMQPTFVISVGDLIEGYSKDMAKVAGEWKEFQTYVHKLQMPFFYVPGNHDLANPDQTKEWTERFGRRYYHFTYRNVLFLCVCSDDPNEEKGGPKLSPEQIDYFTKVLQANPKPRHTIVAVHKPMWAMKNIDSNGWLGLEKVLQGRPYTVFAGHEHRFVKFVRQGQNYYQLATTGGGSKMRGVRYGEFDQIVWVTMKGDAPVIANLLLDGIYSEDMRRPITDEDGTVVRNRKAVYPVRGKIYFEGTPAADALVTFNGQDPKDAKKYIRFADALTDADGSFTMSTYTSADGVPEGEYLVTVERREPYLDLSGKPGPNRLPEWYRLPAKTNLRVQVRAEPNEVSLQLVATDPGEKKMP